ncbi:hypothetical protein UFOVP309_27 [uncultured Caudovirales phage]|uniref:Uncharacterized protein n=1 Tax=uncultured Caudovirales phage TaxID=2100421 RepID=A0A6J5PW03_9CAUD|nr:hypothetical protein UFOVP309_27 [uncultured Caudovirales phage]CAB4173238.1 hypothetical protein UFOVP946_34 [uncultured Caudovirales phage]
MIGLLLGLAILGFGISLCIYENTEGFGILISILTSLFLLIHIPMCLGSSYKYDRNLVERNSFIESLKNARLNNNNYELAAISKDIFQYNKELAILKYENNGILDCYIDDRYLNLKPIK